MYPATESHLRLQPVRPAQRRDSSAFGGAYLGHQPAPPRPVDNRMARRG